jgi:hypothetical protein
VGFSVGACAVATTATRHIIAGTAINDRFIKDLLLSGEDSVRMNRMQKRGHAGDDAEFAAIEGDS